MNKKTYITSLIFLFVALNYGCKKKPFDYRTKYIGDYEFTNSWTQPFQTPSSGITVTNGTIDYGSGKDGLRITLDNNYPSVSYGYETDKGGNLSFSGRSVGTINKSSVHYYRSDYGNGYTTDVSGTKK